MCRSLHTCKSAALFSLYIFADKTSANCELFFAAIVRATWTYSSTEALDTYFKAMKSYKRNKNSITSAALSLAAKKLRPLVKQLLENVTKKEAADVRAKFKENQRFSLEPNQKTGEQLKALSYLLKKL